MNLLRFNGPSNVNTGFRMGPTVQQGGTQTIQQSIYLTHQNPCGVNLLIYEQIGATKITFFQLKEFLNNILKTPEVQDAFEEIRTRGTEYLYNSSRQTQLAYLYAVMNWGKAAFANKPEETYDGYYWRLSVYNYNGNLVWDSQTPTLEIVYVLPNGKYEWRRIPLLGEFINYTSQPPGITVKIQNPFISPSDMIQGNLTTQLYGINNKIAAINSINRTFPLGDETLRSSFLYNQVAFPESVMAISSLLTDPANTRVFGIPRYGFSARENSFQSVLLGYHCAYLNEIFTNDENPTLLESFFIRLSLEQDLLPPN